jgi:lycopene beta-cyclase
VVGLGATGGPDLDVAVVGDGPAGAALAAQCRVHGLSVAVVGPGLEWEQTYGAWTDEVDHLEVSHALGDRLYRSVSHRVIAFGERRHELGRSYGIIDNAALRAHLLHQVDHRRTVATGVQHFTWGSRVITEGDPVDARRIVDATGAGGTLLSKRPGRHIEPAWQTAYGIILDHLPGDAAVDPEALTLMDLREPPGTDTAGSAAVPTFCYALPIGSRWLVEETVLTARPAVDPDQLRDRLARRLGAEGVELVAQAREIERVRIPLGTRMPERHQAVVAFGAAAGYVHPATGFSVAASLRAAPRVAAALGASGDAWEAVWPKSARRARVLHDFGADLLRGLGPADLRSFFDAFFDRDPANWAPYLRVDASAAELSRVMRGVFSSAPWRVRRRLMAGDPSTWLRLIRP